MAGVIAGITMSLDRYITGPNKSPFATHLRFRVQLSDQSVDRDDAAAADLQTP